MDESYPQFYKYLKYNGKYPKFRVKDGTFHLFKFFVEKTLKKNCILTT